jgi:hypothetical protein
LSEREGSALHWRSWPLSLVLLVVYVVTLVSLPSDVGISTGLVLLSPARLALGLALVAAGVEHYRARGADPRGLPRFLLIAWFAYLGAVLVTTATNPSTAGAARLGSLFVEGLAVVWLVVHVARNRWAGHVVERAVVVTTVVVATASTSLAFLGRPYDVLVHSLQDAAAATSTRFGIERQQGPFDGPLFYAIWLVGVSALLLPRIESATGRGRWLWIAAWLLIAVAILTTVSRLAVVGLPLIPAAYLALRGRRAHSMVAFGIACVIAIAVLGLPSRLGGDGTLPLPVPTLEPAPGETPGEAPSPTPVQRIDDPDASNLARFEALKAALGAFVERPLFGWGLLSGKDVALAQLGTPNYVDNSYLVLLIEVGLVGLVAFLLLVSAVLVPAVRARLSATGTARLVACLSLVFSGMFAAVFSVTQLYAGFWVVCGLLISLQLTGPPPEPATQPDGRL